MNVEKWIVEADIQTLQQAMESGEASSEEIVQAYIERIHTFDGKTKSVLEINPEAIEIARSLDIERKETGSRGPLHGIPILLKDNIDTADQMHTSAGSITLEHSFAQQDAVVADKLRAAGAVLLGKTNMTEWAGFMSVDIWAGYSSRGGLTLNPYGPGELFVGGSSSGSAAAVAANFGAAAIGTETSGSIISPASQNSVVGIKPTVGLIRPDGIIPIAFSQDSAGPITRTVTDAAILLEVLEDREVQQQHSTHGTKDIDGSYISSLDTAFLKQARIGIPRYYYQHLDKDRLEVIEAAIQVLRQQGATIIDPVHLPCEDARWDANVMRYEFKYALNNYLSRLAEHIPVHSLAEVIAFNEQHAEKTLKYGQGTLIWAEETSGTLTEQEYLDSLSYNREMAGEKGIDYALNQHKLDALLFLGGEGGSDLAARAGYPIITVPGGYAEEGVIAPGGYITKGPQGISFVGTAWSESVLIQIAYGFEQATGHRVAPEIIFN
ncbi:amidase family protein [Paenibacillus dauci]|uniref:amidase family protein n=1 Tax=Paenibacillus dauci TaxID=1567106 RepID=UPI000619E30B|nr:amidase family protein [Paenibacillus dauci]